MNPSTLNRRAFLKWGVASSSFLVSKAVLSAALPADSAGKKTQFQIACMTLPYSEFPWSRALSGIRGAGFKYVAWGTTHKEAGGRSTPVIGPDAPASKAKELAQRCREAGLEPLMMFSGIYPEAKDATEIFTNRIGQAAAA